MPSIIQRAFAGGEISQDLGARADQVKYQTGLKVCRNFIVQKHGGVSNRTGTRFTVEIKDSNVRAYGMKFVFNDDQTYLIEMGNLYFRFVRFASQIVVAGVAAYNAGTVYAIGALVVSVGINYYSKVAGNVGNTPALSPTQWYALDGDTYEIPTPYLAADLALLKFVQSGDVVTITHRNYPEMELTRTGHTAWALTTVTNAPSIAAPTGQAASGGAGTASVYVVTAVKTDTFEESLPSASVGSLVAASSGTPVTVSWTTQATAQEYNVYKKINNVFGYIGVAGANASPSFIDNGIIPNTLFTPPQSRQPFGSPGNYPSNSTYYQQRLIAASTANAPEKVWTSRSAMFNNLSISSPLQDDDAVTFTVAGKKFSEVRHMIDLGVLVLLTGAAEFAVDGDANGVLRANQPPNLRNIGNNGAALVTPCEVNDSLIFLQARGNVIRDLRKTVSADGSQSSYQGRDLTVFATHLFPKKYSIERMQFAQIPNSIVRGIRSDGTLLGLTYLVEHEIWGWHRHDTLGQYEDIVSIPEGGEDAEYVFVKRTINGVTRRYIERFEARELDDIVDARFLDSFLTYDGRNTGATTMSLSTGAGWTHDDNITITAALGTPFVPGDVGNEFVLNVLDDDPLSETFGEVIETVKVRIMTYTNSTHVVGLPNKTVPVALRGVAVTTWSRAVDMLAGLDHLAGENVGVFADGNVVANPNNEQYTPLAVALDGTMQLADCYSVICVGLPYYCDVQTLDLDSTEAPIRGKLKNANSLDILVKDTRGLFVGQSFAAEDLNEQIPTQRIDYDTPWPSTTDVIEAELTSTWNKRGSICIRQVDPLPATILAVIPNADIGG